MSPGNTWEALGLGTDEAIALGPDAATRVRIFRLLVVLTQELRTLMDQRLRRDGLTTQQVALLTVVRSCGTPTLSEVAAALGTTHQNARQVAAALERKGLLQVVADPADGRVRRLATTAHARARWRRGSRPEEQVLEWFTDLSEEEAATLFELLLRVRRRTRAALAATRGNGIGTRTGSNRGRGHRDLLDRGS